MQNIEELLASAPNTTKCINGTWVPARSENHKHRSLRERCRDAWAVFTGKADAITWPGGQ